MTLEEFLDKRLIIVTGKGGVGKTTVSLAISFLNAKNDRRSIVAMLRKIDKKEHFFGFDKEIGYFEEQVAEKVYALGIVPMDALEEYIREKFLKLFPLYKTMFKLSNLSEFFEAAPGLKELITIGKVWQLGNEDSARSGEPKYNQVIFDAHSTGHALPVFGLPEKILDMVKGGNIKTHVEWVEKFLKDKDKTALVVVTTPEEMAVRETIDVLVGAKSAGINSAFVVVNRLYEGVFDESDKAALEELVQKQNYTDISSPFASAISHIETVESQKSCIEELRENVEEDLLFLDYKFKAELGLDDLVEFASEIEKQIEAVG